MNNEITYKTYTLLPYPDSLMEGYRSGENSAINRHVTWIKEQKGLICKILAHALLALEILVLSFSLIGLPLAYRMIIQANRIEKRQKEEKFYEDVKAINPPTQDLEVSLKTKTSTFNHTHEFVIQNDIIWFRPRKIQPEKQTSEWEPLYFDGYDCGQRPVVIDTDGANLIVLDQNQVVHYKKIIRETRGFVEISNGPENKAKRLFREIKGNDLKSKNFEKDSYFVIDKVKKNNWKEMWFSYRIVHYFINFFTGKRLKLPDDMKAWAISHRGRYNNYLQDVLGQAHYVDSGVTTLYVLNKNGQDIFKSDPWSPKHVKVEICMPETAQTSFKAVNFNAAASHLAAIGYEQTKDKPDAVTLKVYTKLADIDSEGWNPWLPYTYFAPDPEKIKNEFYDDKGELHYHDRVLLPAKGWVSHDLIDDEGQAIHVTSDITIFQTGNGNSARELRLAGQKGEKKGYYYKQLNEKCWHFKENSQIQLEETDLLPFNKNCDKPFETTVHHYSGQAEKCPTNIGIEQITLENFGQRANSSTLNLTVNLPEMNAEGEMKSVQHVLQLTIFKKKTLKNFIGFKGDSYDLIIPREYHANSEIMALFDHQTVIPLQLFQEKDKVKMRFASFQLNFNKTIDNFN